MTQNSMHLLNLIWLISTSGTYNFHLTYQYVNLPTCQPLHPLVFGCSTVSTFKRVNVQPDTHSFLFVIFLERMIAVAIYYLKIFVNLRVRRVLCGDHSSFLRLHY